MNNYTQVPGRLNLNLIQGDLWGITLGFNIGGVAIDLSVYTFESKLIANDGTETTIAVDTTDAINGNLALSLTEEQTLALGGSVYSWYLAEQVGGINSRVLLAGNADISTIKQFTQVE